MKIAIDARCRAGGAARRCAAAFGLETGQELRDRTSQEASQQSLRGEPLTIIYTTYENGPPPWGQAVLSEPIRPLCG